jgi:hypothetical protein
MFRIILLFCLFFYSTVYSYKKNTFFLDNFEFVIVNSSSENNVYIKSKINCIEGELVIPEYIKHDNIDYRVTGILENVFENCESITNISLPRSIVYIGAFAFQNIGIKNFFLNKEIKSIGNGAFMNCKKLENIVIEKGVEEFGNGTFMRCSNLKNVEIPNTVKKIGVRVFLGCESLENIEIPNSVTLIKNHAFSLCKSLKKIKIPDSVLKIEYNAFIYCISLTDIILPINLERIESNTFGNCRSLRNITIPCSVRSIGDYAFFLCNSLSNFTIKTEKVLDLNETVFKNVDLSLVTLKVPKILEKSYEDTVIWKDFKSIESSDYAICNLKIEIEIYPNPVRNYLKIKTIEENEVKKVFIYDVSGELKKTSYGKFLNVRNLAPGIYFLEVYIENKKIVKKIIIN